MGLRLVWCSCSSSSSNRLAHSPFFRGWFLAWRVYHRAGGEGKNNLGRMQADRFPGIDPTWDGSHLPTSPFRQLGIVGKEAIFSILFFSKRRRKPLLITRRHEKWHSRQHLYLICLIVTVPPLLLGKCTHPCLMDVCPPV